MKLADEIQRIAVELRIKSGRLSELRLLDRLGELEQKAAEVGQSWCKSCVGYHSRVYYENFGKPPPSTTFDKILGQKPIPPVAKKSDDWMEYEYDDVIQEIFRRADGLHAHESFIELLGINLPPSQSVSPLQLPKSPGQIKSGNKTMSAQKCLEHAQSESNSASEFFEDKKYDLLSGLEIAQQAYPNNEFLTGLKNQINQWQFISLPEFVNALIKHRLPTTDIRAVQEGMQTPPHIGIIARIRLIGHRFEQCAKLGKMAERISSHLRNLEQKVAKGGAIGTKIFIGHGRSKIWIELKDFIQDRLKLSPDEFNRIPVAGKSNKERILELIGQALFAFLVLTGEDEQSDGKLYARQNVIHEAGLFQGRLGFERAIILLEEDCEEFSNIHGICQIRFPKGNISAAFEEIRRVLEREAIISAN